MHFLDFNIIRLPEVATPAPSPSPETELLVLYLEGQKRKDFLLNILRAAGFEDPENDARLLAFKEPDTALDLATLLLRSPQVRRILIFGLDPTALGLHLQVGHYVPVAVNDRTYLLAHDLETISTEKAAGRPQKAAALWKAVKHQFSARSST